MKLKNIKHKLLEIDRLRDIEILPKVNECFHFLTWKQHPAFEIMPLFEKQGIDNIIVFNFNLDRKHFDYLVKLNAEITLKFNYDEKKELFPDYENLYYTSNHAKIICIKSKNNHYILKGSGNLKRGGKSENYTLHNSKELYEFYKMKIDECKK